MAISKERLQELINEGATIWSDVWDEEVYLNNKCHLEPYHNNSIPTEPVNDYVLWVYEDDEHINKYFISQLEENVKGAKWALKYHATRIEELNLPTWEDVKDKGFDYIFFVKKGDTDLEYYFLVGEQDKSIQIMFREIEHIMLDYGYNVIFNKPLTEENYEKACDLCLKLFKGE